MQNRIIITPLKELLPLYIYSPIQYIAYIALLRSGGRVSEILSIRWAEVIENRYCFVHGLKKSRNYTIDLPECDYLKHYTSVDSLYIFGTLNRATLHRTCIKFGLYIKINSHKSKTVLHLPRHQKADRYSNLNLTDREKADILNHNSTSSQKYYFNKTKKTTKT